MTQSLHAIHLRRPWRRETTGQETVWRRRFQRPTGLGDQTVVSLCLTDLTVNVRVLLNGQSLGAAPAGPTAVRFEITRLLAGRNALELASVEPPGDRFSAADESPGAVWLEIGLRSVAESVG